MSEGPPTEAKAVSIFLDYLALACIFGCVDEMIASKWLIGLYALAAALFFHIVGIKWPIITSKVGSRFDWTLWDKRIARILRVAFVLTWATGVIAGYYAWRQIRARHNISPAAQVPTGSAPAQTPQQGTPASPTLPANSVTRRVDWHDKQNWRKYLHTGMTRTEVRQLFGQPDHIAVISDIESWDYGYGSIDFTMDGYPDGSLYSWYEPR